MRLADLAERVGDDGTRSEIEGKKGEVGTEKDTEDDDGGVDEGVDEEEE